MFSQDRGLGLGLNDDVMVELMHTIVYTVCWLVESIAVQHVL